MTKYLFRVSLISVVASCLLGFTSARATELITDGTSADVAAKISAAAPGDTVTVPAGTFTWTSGVSVSGKAITLAGKGAGRIVGRSSTSVAIGTGAKTFAVPAGLPISSGQTLRIERTGKIASWMQGTVSGYSGTTLQMNVTSFGGSGTEQVWIISTPPTTTIVHSAGTAALVNLSEDSINTVSLTGIQFTTGTGTGDFVHVSPNSTGAGKPIQIYGCWFRTSSGGDSIYVYGNRGIVFQCSFDSSPFSQSPVAIHQKPGSSLKSSWTSPSTMGTADTNGTSNFYVEDCDFHAWLNAVDSDDCGRIVFRHNLMNNAGFGVHGADSSPYGVRHYEVYDNEFVFNGNPGATFNLNWWFYLRGGTGVIADNIMPNINSQDYSDKPEINATVMNLQRSVGPNPLWGKDIAGAQIPAPRQVGYGYVTGKGTDGLGRTTDQNTYVGDSEPLYIYGNKDASGALWNPVLGLSNDYSTPPAGEDETKDYIVAGRDFYNNGTPKPNYSKFQYPHPLRLALNTNQQASGLSAPTNTRVTAN